MKTIILCGGRGWRMNEETEFKPKAMVRVGDWPILIHVMNLYGQYGHKEFLLCLGYRGDLIREYFFNLAKTANDVEVDLTDGEIKLLTDKMSWDYKVGLIETGELADTAERVLIAAKYIKGKQFLVSYGDDVSDVNLDRLIRYHNKQKVNLGIKATITVAHPSSHYGEIWADKRDVVKKFAEKPKVKEYINGGFMVFEQEALKYLRVGEALEDGLARMAEKKKLGQYRHDGFWHAMNTVKDVQYLNNLWQQKKTWEQSGREK